MAQRTTIWIHPEGEPIPKHTITLSQKIEELQKASILDLHAENAGLRQEIRRLEGELHQIIANPELALAQEYEAHARTKAKLAQAEMETAQLTKRLRNCTTMARKKTKKAGQQKAGNPKM